MIKISNVSKHYARNGEQDYEICISSTGKRDTIKGHFTHNAEDGLAVCLRKAADAVDAADAQLKARLMELTVDDYLAPDGLLGRWAKQNT